MLRQVIIRLSESAPAEGGPWTWLVRDAGQLPVVRRGSTEALAEQTGGARVLVLAPASDVLLTRAVVPTRNRQRLLKALPFVLEEQLAGEVERLHFALGHQDKGGAVNVAVVDQGRMQYWLTLLHDQGIQPDLLIPETAATALAPDEWLLMVEDERAWLSTGSQQGFAVEPANLGMIVDLALSEAGEQRPQRLRVWDCREHQEAAGPLPLAGEGVELHVERYQGGALRVLQEHLDEGAALNLLQGAFSRREQLSRVWRPWLPAAAMVLVLLLAQGGMMVAESARLGAENRALEQQINALFLETFPGSRVVNARVQMERQLAELRRSQAGGGGDFEALLAGTAPVLRTTEGLKLHNLRYRTGQLDMDLEVKDLQTLDQLKQALAEAGGWEVDIQSASARAGIVESRLQIRRTGS